MTDSEFDEILHDCLILASAKEFEAIPIVEPEFTRSEARQIEKMLADPWKFALRYREPWVHKLQRWALAAVLLLFLCGYTMLLVPQVRVWAVNILTDWHEEYVEYSFTYKGTKGELVLPEIEVTYVPQGYELEDYQNPFGFSANFDYVNADNQILAIYAVIASDNLNMYADNEHRINKDVVLDNALEDSFLEATENGWPNDLTWTSPDGKIIFSIVGHLPKEEMLKIANGIICK